MTARPRQNPYALFLMVWIFELSPSLTALVIRCLNQVRTLGRWRWSIQAVWITGGQARVCRPEAPALPVPGRPVRVRVGPQLSQTFLPDSLYEDTRPHLPSMRLRNKAREHRQHG